MIRRLKFQILKISFLLLCFFSMASSLSVYAGHDEIKKTGEVKSQLQYSDWVFFDVDDTLLRYDDQHQSYLIDKSIPRIIHESRLKEVKFLALTARGRDNGRTQKELSRLGVHLDPFCKSEVRFMSSNHEDATSSSKVACSQGVLFTGHQITKGDLLVQFLIYIKSQGIKLPERVIFVDDLIENIQSVESVSSVLQSMGVRSLLLFHVKAE